MTSSHTLGPIVQPAVMAYMTALKPPPHAILEAMEHAAAEQRFPIIGRAAGQCLQVMAQAIGARQVFECGSGFGYSAFWFAQAVGPEGRVICTDGSDALATRAQENLTEANLWNRVDYRVGWAQDILAKETEPFDVIYNDVDKDGYPDVWELARTRLRPGGLYIADNCLWQGRVTQSPPPKERLEAFAGWTEGVQAHNSAIANDLDFDYIINPVRDGLIIARKTR